MNFDSVEKWIVAGMPFNSFIFGDCMDALKVMPDNFVELSIVDPPYGLGVNGDISKINSVNKMAERKQYHTAIWQQDKPSKEYFQELLRVSKKAIIWGGNYFADMLNASSCWVVWDKETTINYADCELAWTNFDTAVRRFRWRWNGMLQQNMKHKEIRIHPTQKPVELYRWCLHKYAQPGWKILDTHVGSASSLIACEWEGFDYIGFEKDPDYYAAATKRMENWRKSRTLDLFKDTSIKDGN